MPLNPGDRVVHRRYGPGQVLALFPGRRARVRFDRLRLLPRTLPVADLVPENGGAPQPVEAPQAPRRPTPVVPPRLPLEPGRARLRQVIEALRLGVVPPSHLAEYTVGRGRVLERLRALLAWHQGIEILFGDYGAGKTHLLDLAEQLAIGAGYITARVVLDPNEVPLSHPQRLWRAIVASLRHPGGGEGLVPILDRLRDSREHLRPGGERFSRFLSPVLHVYARGDEDAWGWASDYIEGYPMDPRDLREAFHRAGWRGPAPLALSDFRTYGRVYVHLVGTLATWGADAGAEGLCLLFDEAEHIDRFDRRHRELAQEVLGHYAAATLPAEELGFDPDSLYRGGHAVHRALPLRFCPEQPLAVVMALTPLPEIERLCARLVRRPGLELVPLSQAQLRQLVGRVAALYKGAYPDADTREPILRDPVGSYETPRTLVRAVIAELDRRRYGLPAA